MLRPTKEQQLAIDMEGSNIIVSAGAGSGKTAVLSERVLRKVKDGVDIRKILVLTFTNEAAQEMKSRIRNKIKEAGITEQLEYIDSAYITTFDAFSLAIVKKYHYLLNISKNITIIDSSIIDLEKKKILEDIFLELYQEKDQDFLHLIGDFTNRDDKVIKKVILNLKASLDLKYDKEDYLNKYLDNYYKEERIEDLFKEYFLIVKNYALDIEDILSALEGLLDEKLYIKVYEAYSKFIKPKTYNDLYKIKEIPRVQFRNIPEEAIELKDNLKDTVNKLMELTKYSEEELKEQFLSTKDYVKVIIKIIKELDKRLNQYKLEQEAFEFLDIAQMAIKIVKENADIRDELKYAYNEILIDEYQDTNDLQEMFIKEIENNNVYMVGDIKQSIYRFRNANPNIFKQKYDSYAKHQKGEKIDLLKNFRSRKEVLDNINEIFLILMSEDIGGVDYSLNHAMVYGNLAYINEGANNYNNNMEILKYDNIDKKFSNAEIEAFTIARDIKKKVDMKYKIFDFDLKRNREVLYSDFCIILDRGSDMAKYKQIFEYLNIPMDVYKDSSLTNFDDILILKNIIGLILKINEGEYDTLMRYYYVSIARSFIGDTEDEVIFKDIVDNAFYQSEIYQKCFKLAKNIHVKTPLMLLQEIITEFQFYQKLVTVGDIEASITRIEYLENLASNMQDLGFTIKDFKNYLEEMVENNTEIRYKDAKSSLNCVKIMNIHKSKGLQFPICYYAGFKKDFNLADLQSRFMYEKKYGILTPFYQEGIGVPFIKELIKNNYYKEEIAEKIRLFYVALTRAQEKIIMVVPEFKKAKSQKQAIDYHTGIKFRSFYDFMEVMALNLSKYMKEVDLKELDLTKDYENLNINNYREDNDSMEKIEFIVNKIDSNLIEQKKASKTINKILTQEEARTLEYGTKMHELLEVTNLKEDSHNKIIQNLQKHFDFKKAEIYQELEFRFEEEGIAYQGIIDLMLEYDKEIKIIDYKLKNIQDEAYQKQLEVYQKYIKKVSDKTVSLYLYSILDGTVREIMVQNTLS